MSHSAQPAPQSQPAPPPQSAPQQQPAPHLLVLFDGRCALCHASVRWLLRRDASDRLRFAPAESPAALTRLAAAGFPAPVAAVPAHGQTVLVLAPTASGPQTLLTRSAAVLACLEALPAPWPQLAALARLIPRPLRDLAYRLVAHLRYRLARRYDACPLPAPRHRHRFLD